MTRAIGASLGLRFSANAGVGGVPDAGGVPWAPPQESLVASGPVVGAQAGRSGWRSVRWWHRFRSGTPSSPIAPLPAPGQAAPVTAWVPGPQPQRYAAIDWLKAGGILGVMWVHAFIPGFVVAEPWVEWANSLFRLAVPVFLFCAGFLQARPRTHESATALGGRLRRLAVPYLFASVAALAGQLFFVEPPPTWTSAGVDLLVGNACGVFYFVPVLLGATLLGGLLLRRVHHVWIAVAVLWPVGLLCETGVIWWADLFWQIRNPLRLWGYFAAGWLARTQAAVWQAWPERRRRRCGWGLLILAVILFGACCLGLPTGWTPAGAAGSYLIVYLGLAAAFVLPWRMPAPPAVVWLSQASYPLYLTHYAFVFLLRRWVPGSSNGLLAWSAALGGSIAVVLVGRRVLGPCARTVLG